MRIVFLTALLFTFCFAANAQKINLEPGKHKSTVRTSKEKGTIVVSMDTLYNSGVAFGMLKKKGGSTSSRAVIYTLQGKEVIESYEEGMGKYIFTFIELGGKKAYFDFDMATNAGKLLVKYNLLKPDGLNIENAQKTLKKFPKPEDVSINFSNIEIEPVEVEDIKVDVPDFAKDKSEEEKPKVNNAKEKSGMIIRDRSAAIKTAEGTITQDSKTIATYKEVMENTSYGYKKVVYIHFPDGTLCARVVMKSTNEKTAQVVTAKDSKSREFVKTPLTINDVAKMLVENLYL